MKNDIFMRIGNSSIEFSLGSAKPKRFSHSNFVSAVRAIKRISPKRIWIASVVPSLTQRLKKSLQPLEIKVKVLQLNDIPLRLPYAKTLGVDRALNVFALSRRTKSSFVLVDLGTATTVEFYDRRRGYLGGWIAPGVDMLSTALAEKTAQLPRVVFRGLSKSKFGKSTEESLRLGIQFTSLGLLSEAKSTARQVFGVGVHQLYLTGGAALHLGKVRLWRHVSGLQLEALRKLAENE